MSISPKLDCNFNYLTSVLVFASFVGEASVSANACLVNFGDFLGSGSDYVSTFLSLIKSEVSTDMLFNSICKVYDFLSNFRSSVLCNPIF